jgi:SAM-dependent methyltransferase
MKLDPSLACHSCHSRQLELANGFEKLHRVTSDCKPWPEGGSLAWCLDCGLVQTVLTRRWHEEIEAIYSGYTIYHQSGGAEQPVFAAGGGVGIARSEAIIRATLAHVSVPETGRLLDVGCGNGSFLRSWGQLREGWRLCGSEVSNKYQKEIESIPGVEALFTGSFDKIPGTFDVISLIHVLEHIPAPRQFLLQLQAKLNPAGLLLVEVPDCSQNPFMLTVADHCSHFSPRMLASIFPPSAWSVLHAESAWIPKEITLVARSAPFPSHNNRGAGPPTPAAEDSRVVFEHWKTLERIAQKFQSLSSTNGIGILGTSIGATWLDAQTGQKAQFFVDEDALRIGKNHLGRPVFGPDSVPAGAEVFLALPPVIATPVYDRLRQSHPHLHLVLP